MNDRGAALLEFVEHHGNQGHGIVLHVMEDDHAAAGRIEPLAQASRSARMICGGVSRRGPSSEVSAFSSALTGRAGSFCIVPKLVMRASDRSRTRSDNPPGQAACAPPVHRLMDKSGAAASAAT